MSPATSYKVANLSFYAAFLIACCTVSFSTLLPCPARKAPYASADEMPPKEADSVTAVATAEDKAKGGRRKVCRANRYRQFPMPLVMPALIARRLRNRRWRVGRLAVEPLGDKVEL
jgi:hypothetical protein